MYIKSNNSLIGTVETLFAFENNKITIAEFKRTDLNDSSPPEDRFFWFKHDKVNDEVIRLIFVSMNSSEGKEERIFSKEKIVFDSCKAIFSENSGSVEELFSVDIHSMSFHSKKKFAEFFFEIRNTAKT